MLIVDMRAQGADSAWDQIHRSFEWGGPNKPWRETWGTGQDAVDAVTAHLELLKDMPVRTRPVPSDIESAPSPSP